MPDSIFDAFSIFESFSDLVELLKQGIIASIISTYAALGNFNSATPLYGILYESVADTPSQWNSTIYAAVTGIAENALMMVAGVITVFVLSYDLVQNVNKHNNMHESDVGMFIKWFIKAGITVTLVSKSTTIVEGIFEISSWLVTKANEYFNINTSLSIDALSEFSNSLYEKSIPELLLIQCELTLSTAAVCMMLIIATVVIWSRMIEIFMVISASPIPFATLMNHDWSDIGRNYIKLICAYALQAYLIMIIFAVYSALIQNVAFAESITRATITLITYTLLFGYMFFKTEGIAKSICCAR